jgi:hypothetical protein
MRKKLMGLWVLLTCITGVANAELVTSISGGTVIDIPAVSYNGTGPQDFGTDNIIHWSSTTERATFGSSDLYGFGQNGDWNGLVMAGLNASSELDGLQSMTFEFTSPVRGVGGFLNYDPGFYENPSTSVISVYDSQGNLIESSTLAFYNESAPNEGAPYNSGKFYGFVESDPTIKYFKLSDAYIGITDLTIANPVHELSNITDPTNAAPVPEPSTICLFATGIIGLLSQKIKKIIA